jgi:hypothetical protein
MEEKDLDERSGSIIGQGMARFRQQRTSKLTKTEFAEPAFDS